MLCEKFSYSKHRSLLQKYYAHPDTPINNSSDSKFRPWLWDNKGACWLMIDCDEIVATFGCLRVEIGNQSACKKGMRLHVRSDYHDKFFDFYYKNLDPCCYDWMQQNKISNIFMTVNFHNLKTFINLCRFHTRIKYYLDSYSEYAIKILQKPHSILPYFIEERSVSQYAVWSSDVDWQTSWINTKNFDLDTISKFDKFFPKSKNGWNFTL